MFSEPPSETGSRVWWLRLIRSRMSSQDSSRSMPTISLRGIMMSSTVTFSRSRMESSMRWWRCGIMAPASLTTVRSSSRDSG